MIEIRKRDQPGLSWVQEVYNREFDYHSVTQLDSLYHWFFKLLQVRPQTRLLDVACGFSQLVDLATQRGITAVGVDFIYFPLRQLKNSRSGQYTTGDAERLPFPAHAFDYVTSIGSLEHYVHMDIGVQELARVLKPEGQAIIFVPNTFSLFHNVYMAFKTGWPVDDGQPLQRYASRGQWEELITANGFVIERVHKYEREFPTSWRDTFWYLRHPRRLVYLLLTPFLPLNLGACFAFICRKRSF